MNSRERIRAAINHKQTDKIPIDFSGTHNTGIHALLINKLRRYYGLDKKGVKILDPLMMLGIVDEELLDLVGSDVVALDNLSTLLGYKNSHWKKWNEFSDEELLVGVDFDFTKDEDGNLYTYPFGDVKVQPCAKMACGSYYFDHISRQKDLSNHRLNAREDYKYDMRIIDDEELRYLEKRSKLLYENTSYSIVGSFYKASIGDINHLPGPWVKDPKGIRDMNEWYIAHYTEPEYIKEYLAMQTETALENLKLYYEAVGNKIDVIALSGADFGTQNGLLISKEMFREFYKPYYTKINDWVHKETQWKTWYHSCGSVVEILDDFIEMGCDIMNPIQYTAKDMDLKSLKDKYGKDIVFWGGGIETQKTLSFGTVEDVITATKKNVEILSKNSGFVCGTIHNILPNTPVENIAAFFKAING